MEWCNTKSLQLISLYRQHECLWNPIHDYYKNKIKKNDAWEEISVAINCDPQEVKKKMESLLGSFRRERQKQEKTVKTGTGADSIFNSKWFAFNEMLFLLDKFAPRETKNTDEADSEECADNDQQLNESKFHSPQEAASTTRNAQLSESIVTEVPTAKRKSTNSSAAHSIKKPMTAEILNSRSEEVYQILKDTVANRGIRDGSTIFGEYVAVKHRKYSTHTQSVVEHLIGNILFNADMDKYEPVVAPSFPPPLHTLTVHDEHLLPTGSDSYSSSASSPTL